jgi:hypothetical protein
MAQLFHDAIAIVRVYSQPDLFITMTCNPLWPEISDALLSAQTAQDRPDLVARVFKLKLTALLKDVTDTQIFGRVVAHMHVIEFQKRGLPHAHILLILDPEFKPRNPELIDCMVQAEIPNRDTHPLLFETITRCMFHGPCGPGYPGSPCMKDGKCSRRYPRPYSEHTSSDNDGYPVYRRRDNGVTFTRNNHTFTNRDIVPYNPYLSQKYNCHINVEIATSITAVKYLYKYIYKGHDRASVSLENQGPQVVDEVKEYIDARYVSAPEACWRIFEFNLHLTKPSVVRLPIHEPNGQPVIFDAESETIEDVLQRGAVERTMLTAFFEACVRYPELTEDLLYPDAPSRLTWHSKEKEWRPRKANFDIVGRVRFIPPSKGECFYLRMLLYHIPRPKSYRDLLAFNGHTHPTFQSACAARGLLETDDEWDTCLNEASLMKTGTQFRQLFVTILVYNHPQDPKALYESHKQSLSDDCAYRLQRHFHIPHPTLQQVESLALLEIKRLLNRAGKSLSDYGIDEPSIDFDNLEGVSQIVAAEINYDRGDLDTRWQQGYDMANEDQRIILDAITSAVDNDSGQLFFLDGPGGTGKTFVENLLLARVRSQGYVALAVASSGISAILLDGGRTSHSRFKIPIDINSDSICSISAQSDTAKLIRMAKLIIWDEAPAQNRHCFEAVNRTLRDIRKDNRWFGGIVTVFAGGTSSLLPC